MVSLCIFDSLKEPVHKSRLLVNHTILDSLHVYDSLKRIGKIVERLWKDYLGKSILYFQTHTSDEIITAHAFTKLS